MLARVLSAAVNGIEGFPVEVEVNCGWGDTVIVLIMSILPILILEMIPICPCLHAPVHLLTPDSQVEICALLRPS